MSQQLFHIINFIVLFISVIVVDILFKVHQKSFETLSPISAAFSNGGLILFSSLLLSGLVRYDYSFIAVMSGGMISSSIHVWKLRLQKDPNVLKRLDDIIINLFFTKVTRKKKVYLKYIRSAP